jgi:hypothetical protein
MIENALEYIVKKFNIDSNKPSPFLVNFDRLTDLPALFSEVGVQSGAEIGVFNGDFSEILCKNLPGTTIYSIDPWTVYPVYNNFRKQRHHNQHYAVATEKLSKYPNSKILRKKSMDALADFEDGSLDFVFIDADHRFQSVTNDIAEWGRKVKIGGIVSGHDFCEGRRGADYVGVKHVIEAWTRCYRIHPWFVLNSHGQMSWMWIKTRELP